MLIGSAGLRYINETEISDGKGGKKKVRLGDKVDMMPFEETESGKDPNCDYTAELSYDTEKRHLGKGPYTIRQIGHWPCGRIMLYLKTERTDGCGVYTENIMAA